MNSIKGQTRCCASTFSTVATKFAKGPERTSKVSPVFNVFGGKSVPDVSQRNIKLEISGSGRGLGVPSKLTRRATPIVLLIVRHDAERLSTPTNM